MSNWQAWGIILMAAGILSAICAVKVDNTILGTIVCCTLAVCGAIFCTIKKEKP